MTTPRLVAQQAILSGDVLDATPDEIRAMDVVATIVGGVVVYCSHTEVCSGEGIDRSGRPPVDNPLAAGAYD